MLYPVELSDHVLVFTHHYFFSTPSAERGGFEPPGRLLYRPLALQASAFDHSATSPHYGGNKKTYWSSLLKLAERVGFEPT